MKKAFWIIAPFTIAVAGCAWHGPGGHGYGHGQRHGMSQQGMQHHMQHMQEMDANKDGVASRDEFMKFHETMFDRMKNKDGVIELSAMRGAMGSQCGPTARDPHCGPIPRHGG